MSEQNYNSTTKDAVDFVTPPSGDIYKEGKVQFFLHAPQGGNGEPIPYSWHLFQGHEQSEICKDSLKDQTVVPDKLTRGEILRLLDKPPPETFRCEICGNFRYRDRNGFDRHFRMARHSQGMSKIGIPNSSMFKGITSIEAARDRWDQIQEYRNLTNWKPAPIAGFVDEYGHPTEDNTYAVMRRQGLI